MRYGISQKHACVLHWSVALRKSSFYLVLRHFLSIDFINTMVFIVILLPGWLILDMAEGF